MTRRATAMRNQPDLFRPPLPEGFEHRLDFLERDEEATLLESLRGLPFAEAEYKEWRAKRRIVSYGGRYDFGSQALEPAPPVPPLLLPLRDRVASLAGLPASAFTHAVVTEYAPGAQLGWHRDVPTFEVVAGVSLAGWARMRFRPYPPRGRRRAAAHIDLAPRSAYVMTGPARWHWQHAISPTKELRYSITFRTLREPPR
ncbi:MAG TPA: alpha-ketoglutarate-dependent dioxygenase AlkB [Sandaracinaceae bacterium]